MNVQGILFDKDGTIIDIYEVWLDATDAVVRSLMKRYKIRETTKNQEQILDCLGIYRGRIDAKGPLASKSYKEMAEILGPVLEELAGRRILTRPLKEFLIREYDREVTSKRESYPVFTDLKYLFHQLKARGIKIGIATNDERRSTEICMRKLGVQKHISFWGTAGSQLPMKPQKELAFYAAAQWKISPSNIAVIGDTPSDMKFAKSAGAIGIGVLSGTGDEEELSEHADVILSSIDELLEFLDGELDESMDHIAGKEALFV